MPCARMVHHQFVFYALCALPSQPAHGCTGVRTAAGVRSERAKTEASPISDTPGSVDAAGYLDGHFSLGSRDVCVCRMWVRLSCYGARSEPLAVYQRSWDAADGYRGIVSSPPGFDPA